MECFDASTGTALAKPMLSRGMLTNRAVRESRCDLVGTI